MALKDEENTANTIPCSLMLTDEKIYVCHDEQENTLIRILDSMKLDYVTKVLVDPDCLYYCVLVRWAKRYSLPFDRLDSLVLVDRTGKSRNENLDFLFSLYQRDGSIRSNASKRSVGNFSSRITTVDPILNDLLTFFSGADRCRCAVRCSVPTRLWTNIETFATLLSSSDDLSLRFHFHVEGAPEQTRSTEPLLTIPIFLSVCFRFKEKDRWTFACE